MIRTIAVAFGLSLLALTLSLTPLHAQLDVVGTLFTMSNDPNGNAVLVFDRAADGSLTAAGTFSTGGLGTGGREPDFGLANAGALALSENGYLLFVVNPGSDDVSVFAVKKRGLELLDRQSTSGKQPISVTVKGNQSTC